MLESPRDDDDDFPELQELNAAQAARHRRLIRVVGGCSLVLLVIGIGVLWAADDSDRLGWVPGGLLLVGLGIVGLVRALVSQFTDIDTKDHGDWDIVGAPLAEDFVSPHNSPGASGATDKVTEEGTDG